VLGIAVNSLL